jgi:hypothetical protein
MPGPAIRNTLAYDNFNRANSTNLTPNWTVAPNGADSLQVVSTEARATVLSAAVDNLNYYNAVISTNNQWSEISVGAVLASEYNAIGVGIRFDPTTTGAFYSGYLALLDINAGATRVTLQGSSGTLATASTTVNPVAGDLLSIEGVGSLITVKINDVSVISTTDTARTSGSFAIEAYPTVNLANSVLDNFKGGSFISVGGGFPGRRTLMGVGRV